MRVFTRCCKIVDTNLVGLREDNIDISMGVLMAYLISCSKFQRNYGHFKDVLRCRKAASQL